MRESLGLRTLLLAGSAAAGGAGGAVIAGTIITIDKLVRDPKTPARLAVTFNKVGQLLRKNPDSPLLKRLAVASSMKMDSFKDALSSAASEYTMSLNPMERSLESVKENKEDILNSLQYHNPDVASQLRKAFASDNDQAIGEIMSQVEQIEGSSNFIQPGVGYDGKVYSETDKLALEEELNNANVPGYYRMQQLAELRKNGTIPNLEEVPSRVKKSFVPNPNKFNKDY
jgi:hypothetical protein